MRTRAPIPVLLALSLASGLARSGDRPATVAAAMVDAPVPGPGPVVPRRIPLSAPLGGESLQMAWQGPRLLVSDGVSLLVWVDPSTGQVSPATLPSPGPVKKPSKGKKAPPPVPVVPQAIAVGPSGSAALLSSGIAWVFDPSTGVARWKQPANGATRLQWSVDGTALEGGGNQRHVVWAASSGTPLEAPDTRAGVYAYGALQQRLVVAVGGRIELYDGSGTTKLGESTAASALILSPDARQVAVGGDGIWLFDAEGRASRGSHPATGVRALRFSPDGSRIAAAGKALSVLDSASAALVAEIPLDHPATGLTWTADGQLLWTDGEALYTAAPASPDLACALPGAAAITALASGPSALAAGDAQGGVAVWGPDGALRRTWRGTGSVRSIALDVEEKHLAIRQSGDLLLDLDTGATTPCAPTLPACAALGTAPTPLLPERLRPDTLAVALPSGVASASGEAVRIWDSAGALLEQRWFGEVGAWARWTPAGYTWGGMELAFKHRNTGERLAPPASNPLLMLDRPSLTLMDGGPPADLTLVLTNTGSGPAYALRLRGAAQGPLALDVALDAPRFGPGERALLPVGVRLAEGQTGAVQGEIVVSTLGGAEQRYPVAARVEPFPVHVERFKRKGDHLKLSLTSAGQPLLKDARVWLLVEGAQGGWTAVSAGEAGKLHPYKGKDHPPLSASVSDTLDLSAPGSTELVYRLPDKAAPRRVEIVVLAAGGSPRALPVPLNP